MESSSSTRPRSAAERRCGTCPGSLNTTTINLIIVENVVDARLWVMWDAWLHAMDSLGYNHKAVYLNSMHAWPTPQSRDRMYVVFWKKGNRAPNLDFTPAAYCQRCEKNVQAIQSWKNPNRGLTASTNSSTSTSARSAPVRSNPITTALPTRLIGVYRSSGSEIVKSLSNLKRWPGSRPG
jgi:site-specific DNA-cytosine methylase